MKTEMVFVTVPATMAMTGRAIRVALETKISTANMGSETDKAVVTIGVTSRSGRAVPVEVRVPAARLDHKAI